MSLSKVYPAINYDFQPTSYWSPAANPLDVALRDVKGRNRREMIRDFYAEGNLEVLCDELLSDTLDEEVRDSIGRIHPSFMGGEYLPNYARHQVEIARIELESTTSDVTSVRARLSGERIKYTVCDEYESEFKLPQRSSSHPFSLRKLIWFWTTWNTVNPILAGIDSGSSSHTINATWIVELLWRNLKTSLESPRTFIQTLDCITHRPSPSGTGSAGRMPYRSLTFQKVG